jgi:hypothetical protein
MRRRRPPPALALSVALGAVGLALFAVGAMVGSDAVFVAGVAAGALSLGSALYWRSELITSWRQERRPRR